MSTPAAPVIKPIEVQQPPKAPVPQAGNLLTQAQMQDSAAQKFDLGAAAGPATSAQQISVGPDSLVSGRLNQLLTADNPYIQMARTRAAQAANRRGLLNSSIAAGAGEAAAIEAALPIAQGDAQNTFEASRFNAGEQNLFARDQNNFMREGAITKMNNLATTERMGLEAGLNERRDATVYNRELDRMSYENDLTTNRTIQQFNNEMARLGFENQLKLSNVPIEFSMNVAANTQNQIADIMKDPNLSPEAKKGAIENLVAYANNSMGWAEKFFGVDQITRIPTGFESGGTTIPREQTQQVAAAPVAAPAPAPAQDPSFWDYTQHASYQSPGW